MITLRNFTTPIAVALLGFTSAFGQGTVIDNGSPTNKWILHNPEDSRKTLFLAPWNNNAWDWGAQTQFRSNGDIIFPANVGIGTVYTPLLSKLQIEGDFRTTTGRFSSIYSLNTDGIYPATYINTLGDAQLTIGANWTSGLTDLSLINSNIANTSAGGFSFWQMTGPNSKRMLTYIRGDGNVGIGTTNPVSKLHISGGGFVLGTNAIGQNTDGYLSVGDISTNSTPTSQNWGSATTMLLSAQDYSTIGFHDSGNRVDFIRSGNGKIDLGYDGGWGRASIGLPNGVWNSTGNVGIGTTDPGTYKLAVEGKIGAREVEVKIGSWADFVFQPGYRLRPLSEVASYVAVHQHLPRNSVRSRSEGHGHRVRGDERQTAPKD